MKDFSLSLGNIPRICGLYPKVEHLAFHSMDTPKKNATVRMTRNFAVIFKEKADHISYEVDNREVTCKTPAFLHLEPWERKYRQSSPEVCEKLYFIYAADLPQFADLKQPPEKTITPLETTPENMEILDRLITLGTGGIFPGIADRIDQACAALLQEWLLNGTKHSALPESDDREKIMDSAEYLKLHCAENRNYDELARSAGMSRRTFNRKWKQFFPLSPKEFQTEKRIEEAKHLLTESDMKIYEIAEQTGFFDPYHFSKTFRKRTGMPPVEFRKRKMT